jgi:penicillin amidase
VPEQHRHEVRRDAWGIPHLTAGSVDALAFAQGREAARERTWQLELGRWRAEGTSAERLGPSGLEWDVFARQVRLADTARRALDRLDDTTRGWLQAYVDGVNSALPQAVGRSYEHRELGVEAWSARWETWTPLGLWLVQHALFGALPHKLWRFHVARTLGPQALGWLSVEDPVTSGSNAWALAGTRTASGSPLLAGDPHRVLDLPGVYQQVHLVCPGVDVVGLAVPGVPGVAHFGHAGTVAWGITNAMADAQDLFVERLVDRGGEPGCSGPDGWEPLLHSATETVRVRGGDEVQVEVLETPRGPVVARGTGTGPAGEEECLSVRTPSRVEPDLGTASARALLSARTVDDVEAALRGWVEPVNSVVVAGADGRVRHLLAGRVPDRDDRDSPWPREAWSPRAAWRGCASLPVREVDDLYVAANDRRDDTAPWSAHFAPSHRARRIAALLGDRTELTVDDLATVHVDTSSAPARALQRLLADLDLDLTLGAVRDRLVAWDARMDADSLDAGLFARWRGALVRSLCTDPVLADLLRPNGFPLLYFWFTHVHERVGGSLERLAAGLGPARLDVHRHATAALAEVAADPGEVPWGRLHHVDPVHPLEHLATTRPPQVPSTPLGGDTDCVLATTSLPGIGDSVWRGPVARWVWDLADRRASRWVVPFGASGHVGSPHLHDQLPLWARGDLVPVDPDPADLVLDGTWPPEEEPVTTTPAPPARPDEVGGAAVAGLGRVWFRRLDPDRDAEQVHAWATQDRARFWGMGDHTVEQVREVYRFVDGLTTHHAFLLHVDDEAAGVFQTYEPEHDPVGECYDVVPGDLGMHLLLAPARERVTGFTELVGGVLAGWMFADPAVRRVVGEPDARNDAALARLERSGFELGPVVDKPEKRARLVFLDRSRYEAVLGAAAG